MLNCEENLLEQENEEEFNEEETTCTCEKCGAEVDESDITYFDEMCLCEECIEEHTFICCDCDNRHWSDESHTYGDGLLCDSCYDYDYTNCEACDRVIHNDDVYRYDDNGDEAFCERCYNERKEKSIHSYNYKPNPIFYNEIGNWHDNYSGFGLFYGVELEIDEGGEDNDNADKLLNIANYTAEHLYIKHDGSIKCGFELVSHPMTLQYHANEMPWRKLTLKALSMGYKSHDCATCGLHVHVGRQGLGATSEEQEDVIARILHFVEQHWNELLIFSRRTEAQINQWAARYGVKENPKETLKHAKDNYRRYVCLNLQNNNTIEFRIFRGSLRYETFIAALQIVDEICNTAILMSDEELQNMTWTDFVTSIDTAKKPELISYLKTKKLYQMEGAN